MGERWKIRLQEAVPLVLAAWLGLALLHAVLCATVGRGILRDPGLGALARVALLGTEGLALVAACALLAVPFGGIVYAERRMRRPWIGRVARGALAGGLLTAYAASWAAFWIGGRFLDGRGLSFYFGNAALMLGYAIEMHPVALTMLPLVAVGTGAAASVFAPRAASRLGPAGRRRAGLGFAAGVAACAIATLSGEAVRGREDRTVSDAETGVAFSMGEYFEMRRDLRAGPLIHAFFASNKERALRDDPVFAGARGEEIRRPLLSAEAHAARADRSRLPGWNIVVVLVDSLRTDQLRAYGGARDVMPTLDGLAREGRVYLNHFSNGTMTDIAAPCPNTSHHPLRKRTLGGLEEVAAYPRVLLPDVLKALGYRTAFIASNNEYWGGTVHLLWTPSIDHFWTAGARIPAPGPSAVKAPSVPAVDDADTVEEALRWLASSGSAPFYLYLNFQNSHAPYRTPEGFPRAFGKTPDYTISAGFFPLDRLNEVKDVYADSLRYVDAQLERLVARLKASGAWDRTVFMLSADHGEAFHEHGFGGHAGRPYDTIARVPLIVRAPGLAPGPDETPAQLTDIAPTVCGLLGVAPHPSFQGTDLRTSAAQGRSLFIVSQTVLVRDYAIVRGGHKLIYDADAARYLLFDRVADPGERTNLAGERPAVVKDLARRLQAWRTSQIDYYEDRSRWGFYPPVLKDP